MTTLWGFHCTWVWVKDKKNHLTFAYSFINWIAFSYNKQGVNFINVLRAPFFVQKYFVQLFSRHSLASKFFGAKILAQKLLTKC